MSRRTPNALDDELYDDLYTYRITVYDQEVSSCHPAHYPSPAASRPSP